jgi:cytochrome P450
LCRIAGKLIFFFFCFLLQALSDKEIFDETIGFYFAGQDTTSHGLSLALMELSLHPEWQERVRQEVESVLGKDGLPTWENYTQLKLCEGVAKEVLRLLPVVTIAGRTAAKDVNILGHEVAKGTGVFMNLGTLHRDPALWGEDADEFKPDRWLDKERIPEWGYLPFGGGGHACIGSKLALLELTNMIALLIRAFNVSIVKGQTIRRVTSVTSGLKEGLLVEFRRVLH